MGTQLEVVPPGDLELGGPFSILCTPSWKKVKVGCARRLQKVSGQPAPRFPPCILSLGVWGWRPEPVPEPSGETQRGRGPFFHHSEHPPQCFAAPEQAWDCGVRAWLQARDKGWKTTGKGGGVHPPGLPVTALGELLVTPTHCYPHPPETRAPKGWPLPSLLPLPALRASERLQCQSCSLLTPFLAPAPLDLSSGAPTLSPATFRALFSGWK